MPSWNRYTEAFLHRTAKDFRISKIVNYFLDFIEIGNNVEIQAKTDAFPWVVTQ